MMKKTILMFAAAGLLLATPSCKKGENDPFMSLKSRKSRLAGTWNLVSGDWTSTNTYDVGGDTYVSTDTYAYDGTNRTNSSSLSINGTVQGTPSTNIDLYAMEHTFEKSGAYSTLETTNGNTWQASGWWSFVGKSKTADIKNKEAVIVTYEQVISGGNISNYTGKSMTPDGHMMLDKLKNKEASVIADYTYTYSNGDSYSFVGTWNLEKQ